ncbi:hypothetical protein DSO57_1000808 [Entomophthora muscae]|uniref:Uncharacterized protein n=1 Tax=Entomophthora muscae TaxID=34485 RepID=A0ACC2U719_9FUNG|nr:hypothetical protein DSO57_1000808 [Entomophthora muscae]
MAKRARGSTILAEHATSTGNFTTVTQNILEKIPPGDSKLTYVYDRYLFHYVSENEIVYLCMAEETFGRRIPFAFLEDVRRRFVQSYSEDFVRSAPVYGINEFSKILHSRMDFYSSDPSADRDQASQR